MRASKQVPTTVRAVIYCRVSSSDDQAEKLLRVIWQIMVGFVEISFGVDSASLAVDRSSRTTTSATHVAADVLSSASSTLSQKKQDNAAQRRAVTKEDS